MLFDPFGVRVDEVLAGATAAGEAGFGGVWLYDHLAGSVHGRARVLECWTTLTAIAATVPRVMVGPLVLNVANRPAGTLAVMAVYLAMNAAYLHLLPIQRLTSSTRVASDAAAVIAGARGAAIVSALVISVVRCSPIPLARRGRSGALDRPEECDS